jgi:hypothetical protein
MATFFMPHSTPTEEGTNGKPVKRDANVNTREIEILGIKLFGFQPWIA